MITDLGKNPTSEKINRAVCEHLQGKWITSYRYNECTPNSFKSSNIPWNKKNSWFNATLLYIHNIAKKAVQMDWEGLESKTAKEVSLWDGKGMLCAYTSVLHACLLYELRIAKSQEIHLVQGYYKHGSGGFYGNFMEMCCNFMREEQGDHLGIHAWITLCDAVLDLSIVQEQLFFDFNIFPWIVEEVPVGMELVGWKEDWDIIKNYARKIARESNMKYYEWIDYHKKEIVRMIERINNEGIEFIAS